MGSTENAYQTIFMALAQSVNQHLCYITRCYGMLLSCNIAMLTEVWHNHSCTFGSPHKGQVENAEVRKPKYENGSTETEIQK